MERILQDIRFGLRLFGRDRAFALTALLTLGLCIGANSAIFAVVNSVLLRPLPIPEPERMVLVHNSYPNAGVQRASNGVPDYFDRLRETDVFEELALYNTRGVTITMDGQPQRITAMVARPSLLRMLKVAPARGRIFTEDEGEQGSDTKVVLTDSLWQRLYGGRDDAVGSRLRINGAAFDIVGVLPAGFRFLSTDADLWMPLSFSPEEKSDDSRHSNNWSMVGRLKPGATIGRAQQEIDALNDRNMERFPEFREILTNAGFRTVVKSLQQDLVEPVSTTLYLLWGGAVFVLLIGGVNLANLVLIRSTARLRELATRHALGAGIGRLTRQLLTETVLLTIAGGLLGLLVGYGGLALLTGVGIERIPRGAEVQVDGAVAAFTFGLALAVGVLLGLAPAVGVRRMNLSQAFREEGRSGTSGRAARHVRRVLVASQIAFAFMLLAAAGVLLASFQRVLAIDPGFDPSHVLTARVSPPASRYAGEADLRSFSDRLLREVRGLPGVRQAAIGSHVPFIGDYSDGVILAEGYTMAPGESVISPYRLLVTPGYFETLGVRLRAGRTFTDADTADAPRVVIVDERLARKFWNGRDPIGRRMYQPDNPEDILRPGPNARWLTVVGVVDEIRVSGLAATDDRAGAYYFPAAQTTPRNLWLLVRSAADPTALVPMLRKTVSNIDSELPLFNVRTMEERLDESLFDRRTPMVLAVTFAAVALFLAVTGIYGVLAYQVSQRRREIGIRMALGSGTRRVFGLVLREGAALVAAGLAAGLGGAFAIRRALQAQLYGVAAMDPVVLGLVCVVLAAAALLACAVPARRASRIDPAVALGER